jgi:hypothetical protein
MRSQVQVLAGPPPILAGHSAAGSEPGAFAARPGPRWGRTPIPAGPSPGPSGATHPAVSLGDDHPPWSRPSPKTPATRRVPPPGAAARSRATAPPPATGAPHAGPAWLVAQRQARPPRPPPTRRPGSAPTSPDHPDSGSVARLPASATVGRAVDGPPATGPPPVLVVRVARPPRPGFPTPPPEHGGDGRVRTDGADSRRLDTDGWTADGWTPTGGQRTAERRTRWTTIPGDQTPDGWTAGSRTPNRDGWTPGTDAVAWLLAGSTTATTPDRSIAAGHCSGPTSSGRATTRTAQPARTPRAPRCHGRAWPPPPPSAAGGTPPSSWHLGALLSSDDHGSSLERTAKRHPLWRGLDAVLRLVAALSMAKDSEGVLALTCRTRERRFSNGM